MYLICVGCVCNERRGTAHCLVKADLLPVKGAALLVLAGGQLSTCNGVQDKQQQKRS